MANLNTQDATNDQFLPGQLARFIRTGSAALTPTGYTQPSVNETNGQFTPLQLAQFMRTGSSATQQPTEEYAQRPVSAYNDQIVGAKEQYERHKQNSKDFQSTIDNTPAGQMVGNVYVGNPWGTAPAVLGKLLSAWNEKGDKDKIDALEAGHAARHDAALKEAFDAPDTSDQGLPQGVDMKRVGSLLKEFPDLANAYLKVSEFNSAAADKRLAAQQHALEHQKPYTLTTDAGGNQYWGDAHNPQAPAIPVNYGGFYPTPLENQNTPTQPQTGTANGVPSVAQGLPYSGQRNIFVTGNPSATGQSPKTLQKAQENTLELNQEIAKKNQVALFDRQQSARDFLLKLKFRSSILPLLLA